VAIIKKRLNLEMSLYTLLQILSVTAFEKTPLFQLVTEFDSSTQEDILPKQLELFKL
jgi:hypothetical protein